jgi:hypothetical protein
MMTSASMERIAAPDFFDIVSGMDIIGRSDPMTLHPFWLSLLAPS